MKTGKSAPRPAIFLVRPARAWNGINWREIWDRRELAWALIKRDIQARYRQTIAGVLWVIGQPVITTILLSLIVTRLVGQTQSGVPYPLFVYVAMMAWAYISHALTRSALCFLEQAPLVQRVYLPRILVPFASIMAALVDFGVALLVMPFLWVWYHVLPSWTIIFFPCAVLLMVVTVFGMGLWVSIFNAEFRDIGFALPFFLQVGLFISPMFYSSDMVPWPWRWVYALNPVVGIVESFRWTLLSPTTPAPLDMILISTFSALVILSAGFYIFQNREPALADVL